MATRVNYSGFVIAGIGFFVTRFTVTLAIFQDPLHFFFAGVVPLVVGLGLAAFGVALAVVDVDSSLVRTTALWCVIGLASMLVLGLLTLLGTNPGTVPDLMSVDARTQLSNFLIGGSVGGTLTGLYAAHSKRQQVELRQHASRLAVLNRLLRHEIINAVSVIRGYATLDRDADNDVGTVIEERSDEIVRTINQVKYLARSTASGDGTASATDLVAQLEASVAAVRDRHPAATIGLTLPEESVPVRANERLEPVFTNLLENAVVHDTTAEPRVDVTVSVRETTVEVSVRDRGPGLPAEQRALLEDGAIGEYDDPSVGFGLNIVRLLVESFGGGIETHVDDEGSTVTVVLRRQDTQRYHQPLPTRRADVRPAIPHLVVTIGAALVAGLAYGVVAGLFGGSVSFIGVYYGIQNATVGWITHEFHSLVFAFIFAGLVSLVPVRYRSSVPSYVLFGMGWGVVVWTVAAGVISPFWLQLVGVPVSIPSFNLTILASHLAWGATLGLLTAVGYELVVPRLE